MSFLKNGNGVEDIHSRHLKFDSELSNEFLSMFFTSSITHNHIPLNILKGIIKPVVKNAFGDLSKSDIYRPVMNSSVILKLFEYCLLDKIEPYIRLNDRQYGFRKK